MCYRCATNPSIHHHCCCIVAMSSLLSHHGVTFTVMVSPSSLHCCGFVVAIAMLPSCRSQFYCCHCSVAFIITSSRCHHRSHIVTISLSPSQCHLRHRIIAVSLSQSGCYGAFAVTSSQFYCHHRSVAFIVALSQCSSPFRCCRCSVTFIVASLRFCFHCCGCLRHRIIVVSSSQFHRRCCGVAFTVTSLQFHCRLTVSSLQSHCCHHHHHHCCIIAIIALLLPSLSHCCCYHCHLIAVIVVTSLPPLLSCSLCPVMHMGVLDRGQVLVGHLASPRMLWPLLCTGALDQEVQWTGQDTKRICPGSTHFLWMQSGSQHCKGAGPWASAQAGHLALLGTGCGWCARGHCTEGRCWWVV